MLTSACNTGSRGFFFFFLSNGILAFFTKTEEVGDPGSLSSCLRQIKSISVIDHYMLDWIKSLVDFYLKMQDKTL